MWKNSVDYLIYDLFGMSGRFADALHFFIYDTIKIWFLLLLIIYVVSFLRTYFNTEYVRDYLQGKSKLTGNVLAALFGVITPFCSCSAIPLFLGFMQARIPKGVTFSFLISSPMNNEIAIALLFSLFGWKIALLYITFGLLTAIIGGYAIGEIGRDEDILILVVPSNCCGNTELVKDSLHVKSIEAWNNTWDIYKKIYLYVLLGVGVGALFHGYIPADFVAKYTGEGNPFSVLIAVLMGVPMYASAAAMMPLVEVLTSKGMLLGTALSFMMAVTALSLPEAMILKKILHVRLIGMFFGIVGLGIVVVGYVFNAIL
ncbi:permease [Sulfurospirillum arcachonense]|uniref:permease n=1 Tax=Sulfurospirillum arcachonense TaxID=57666 RepID=UPI00046AE16A|nr:permease [Sulfurospirillum arcachonense]